jgi:hypothetical protein
VEEVVTLSTKLAKTDSADKTETNGKLFLGVVLTGDVSKLMRYDIYVGTKRSLIEMPHRYTDGAALVSLKRIPSVWRTDLGIFHSNYVGIKNKSVQIGYIDYTINFSTNGYATAMTESYYPRSSLGPKYSRAQRHLAPKIPYFMEAITVHDLMTKQIDYVATSYNPSYKRYEQLSNVGLFLYKETEIKEWLRGLGRGIREKVQK